MVSTISWKARTITFCRRAFTSSASHIRPSWFCTTLEVADRNAAGVGKNVRQDGDAAAGENLVGVRCGGAVGSFGDDAGFDGLGVVQGNDVFKSRGAQNVALHGQQLVIADARGAGHPDYGAGTLCMAEGLDGVDAAGVGDAAAGVA